MLHLARRLISATRDGRLIPGIRRRLWPRRRYLRSCCGVIHVGANNGEERHDYAARGLSVIWIEPIPEVFADLARNIRECQNQTALQALVTDEDGRPTPLHVSNINGVFSSILDLHKAGDIWPAAAFTHDIQIVSARLPTLLAGRDLTGYDALVLDTQGSELMILRGAEEMLPHFAYIECESATFEAYRGCPTVDDIALFLSERGFRLVRKDLQAPHPSDGACYDLLFRRSVHSSPGLLKNLIRPSDR